MSSDYQLDAELSVSESPSQAARLFENAFANAPIRMALVMDQVRRLIAGEIESYAGERAALAAADRAMYEIKNVARRAGPPR